MPLLVQHHEGDRHHRLGHRHDVVDLILRQRGTQGRVTTTEGSAVAHRTVGVQQDFGHGEAARIDLSLYPAFQSVQPLRVPRCLLTSSLLGGKGPERKDKKQQKRRTHSG